MPQHPASGQDANPPLLRLQTNNNRSQTSQNNVLWLMQGRMAIRPATAARLRSLSQKSQNPQKQIINLFNQINLSEPPNSPFCAICERGVTTTAFVLGRIAIRPYGTRRNSMYNYLTISNINRASGCNFSNDLMLTASEAMPATWGKLMKPIAVNRGAVADSAN